MLNLGTIKKFTKCERKKPNVYVSFFLFEFKFVGVVIAFDIFELISFSSSLALSIFDFMSSFTLKITFDIITNGLIRF